MIMDCRRDAVVGLRYSCGYHVVSLNDFLSRRDKVLVPMQSVLVFMSTYNGGELIRRQVKSIMEQRGVHTYLLVRDDGSMEETQSVLADLSDLYQCRMHVDFARNIGWMRSFQRLLQDVSSFDYDYYAFSDQDDVWMPEKLVSCIRMMEEDDRRVPKLCQCQSLTTDENLKALPEQEVCYPSPKSHKMCIAQEYFRGCSMVWNQELMTLLQEYQVTSEIPHDYWVGLLGYFFGHVYFCKEPLFCHIRYSNSSSCDGNIKLGRQGRIKNFLNGKRTYINPANELLAGYRHMLRPEDIEFLEELMDYRRSFSDRMKLFFDRDFRRESRASTTFLKLNILLGRY